MEELFKNKTKYTNKEYEMFLEQYQKEFATSEILYMLFNFAFWGFCAWFAFSYNELTLGIIITIGLLIYAWYKFVFENKRLEKNEENNKLDGNFINEYKFYKNNFKVSNPDGEATIFYFKLYRIVETDTNFYLYISREYALIISKNGFEKGTCDEFSKFIKKKKFSKYKNRMLKKSIKSETK